MAAERPTRRRACRKLAWSLFKATSGSGARTSLGVWRSRARLTSILVSAILLGAGLPSGNACAARLRLAPSQPAGAAQATGSQAGAPEAPAVQQPAQGGIIRGAVVAGTPGKPGGVPLPGVAVTAKNTLTGRQYTTATDVDGAYALKIPRNGRYVVRAEITGFAPVTQEVVLDAATPRTGSNAATSGPAAGGSPSPAVSASGAVQVSNFGLELASRASTETERAEAASRAGSAAGAARGLQGLGLSAGLGADTESATEGSGGNAGASLPSLGSLATGDNGGAGSGAAGSDSFAVSGVQGSTNALAGVSEDDIRQRVQEGVDMARQTGLLPPGSDPTEAIVGVLRGLGGGGAFSQGGGGGGFGGGGGGRGGRGGRGGGGGGGGFGAFRNFNPAQPHGAIFWQGGNNALNSAPWSPDLVPEINPAAYQNRFGVSIAGSPYIPGLFKPSTKQFVFLNLTGQKNLNAFSPAPVRVPTPAERSGDFSNSYQLINGSLQKVHIYNPATGAEYPNDIINTPLSVPAVNLLNSYYPTPNVNTASTDPTVYNYQTVSNAGSNNVAINSRYVRTIGQSTGGPFGFGGRGGGGGGGGNGQNRNAPPTLRQNINVAFNYSHSAQDNRNIFLPLGGASETDGDGLSVGYTIGYGRLSNNASVNWNRSSAETRNYFTDTANNPTGTLGIDVPNGTSGAPPTAGAGLADARFYNGVPHVSVSNFAGLTNQNPSQTINQTISFSDFVSWRKNKHNMRYGLDVRRVHADSIGGSNPLGTYSFTGYATESASDQGATVSGTAAQASTGSGLADFLLGLPTNTSIQASLYKTYLRENVLDAYAQDDWRVLNNVTLNYGLRWEYFSPYVEKNNRLVNLDHNANFTSVDPVQPGQNGTYFGAYPRSLVNPDRTMFAPRFGGAWRPQPKGDFLKKLAKNVVMRGGYGINYNTGQVTTFAQELAFQPPFAATQTNTLSTAANTSQCSYANGFALGSAGAFNCSGKAIQNNYAVNPNYRLGMVQIYNLNLQKGLPGDVILNIGYNGSKGANLDTEYEPNQNSSTVTTSNAQAFLYEDSVAGSHMNQLFISANKRQYKGLQLGTTYQYSHAIDNAASIGGGLGVTAQNPARLDLEEGNSSFDVRHRATVNFNLQAPFGPNRPFLSKGEKLGKVLDGFILSGMGTFATGTYFTPQYGASAAEALAGGYYTLRPDRVFSQTIAGPGKLGEFFNTAAFAKPAAGFGTASRNSIEGPGTTSVSTSLSRLIQLGDTRSFEVRMTATNVFNTVQYSTIDVNVDSATYGQVKSAAQMRQLQFVARYRF